MEFKINGVKIQGYTKKYNPSKNKRFPYEFVLLMYGQSKFQAFGKSYKNSIITTFALAGCGNYRAEPALLGRMLLDAVGENNLNWKPIISILKAG